MRVLAIRCHRHPCKLHPLTSFGLIPRQQGEAVLGDVKVFLSACLIHTAASAPLREVPSLLMHLNNRVSSADQLDIITSQVRLLGYNRMMYSATAHKRYYCLLGTASNSALPELEAAAWRYPQTCLAAHLTSRRSYLVTSAMVTAHRYRLASVHITKILAQEPFMHGIVKLTSDTNKLASRFVILYRLY